MLNHKIEFCNVLFRHGLGTLGQISHPGFYHQFVELDDHIACAPSRIAVSTMHLAKGLEFRVVVNSP